MEGSGAVSSGGFAGRLQPPFTFERVVSFIAVLFLTLIIFSQYNNLSPQMTNITTLGLPVESANTKHRISDRSINLLSKAPSCSRLSTLSATIVESKQMIWNNWNISSFPNFLNMMHIPAESWSIQKAKFVDILVSDSVNRSFVVGFSGSSVTAGHDNYFYEAYPNIFYESMLPSMSQLLDNTLNSPLFVVRNHALGNNPCYAYDACVETHLGDDLDILTWEQSMNCGHAPKHLDTFARASYQMKKKPTLWFLQSGTPFWTAEECAKLNLSDTLAPKTTLTSDEKKLLASPFKLSASSSGHMSKMEFLKEESNKFVHERFAMLAPMGQNVFSCEAYKCRTPYPPTFSQKTPGGGANWHPGRLGHKLRGQNLAYSLLSMLEEAVSDVSRSLCSSAETSNSNSNMKGSSSSSSVVGSVNDSKCNMTTVNPERLRKNNNNNNNSTFISNNVTISNNNASSSKLSVKSGKRLLSSSSSGDISSVVDNVMKTLTLTNADNEAIKKQLVSGLTKSINSQSVSDDRVALLVATVLREYSLMYLNALQSTSLGQVPSSYDVDETNTPSTCYTNFEPRMSHSLSQQIVQSNWTLDLSWFDKSAVLKNENKHMGYLDRKNVFISSGVKGSRISIRIHSNAVNPIWLCELQKGFGKYPATMGDLNKESDVFVWVNYDDSLDKSKVESVDVSKLKRIELTDFSDQCYRSTTLVPAGDHLLIVMQKGSLQINLAYVVTF